MREPLVPLLVPFHKISVIGMAKNVGKTTVLNYLIANLAGYCLTLTSIGRDGEETDVVTNTRKPRIYVPAGSVIITAEGLLGLSDITVEVLMTTGYGTPMGRVVVVRALSAGFVQLGGPSVVNQLAELLEKLPEKMRGLTGQAEALFGAADCFEGRGCPRESKVIIDGAISRKSLASPGLSDAAVLCTGASVSPSEGAVIAETKHAVDILTLPAASGGDTCVDICGNTGVIYLSGAVSDKKVTDLLTSGNVRQGMEIIADDPSKIFISAATLARLNARGVALSVKARINLVAVTVNPVSPRGFSFDPEGFLMKMRDAVDVPVFDVVN